MDVWFVESLDALGKNRDSKVSGNLKISGREFWEFWDFWEFHGARSVKKNFRPRLSLARWIGRIFRCEPFQSDTRSKTSSRNSIGNSQIWDLQTFKTDIEMQRSGFFYWYNSRPFECSVLNFLVVRLRDTSQHGLLERRRKSKGSRFECERKI